MNKQKGFFPQNMELERTTNLDSFLADEKLFPVGKLLQKLYHRGGNSKYLASIYNSIFSDGKMAFMASYYGINGLFSKDPNQQTQNKNISWQLFVQLFLQAHRSNFLHIIQVVKLSDTPESIASIASIESTESDELLGECIPYNNQERMFSEKDQLSHRQLLEISLGGDGENKLNNDLKGLAPEDYLIVMLSYPQLLNCACKLWGREKIALQKSRIINYAAELKKYLATNGNTTGSYTTSVPDHENTLVAEAKLRAKSLGLMATPSLPLSKTPSDTDSKFPLLLIKLKEKMDRYEYEFLTAKATHKGLLEQALMEEEKRLECEGEENPILIQNAVMAAIRAGQQKRKMEDAELEYLRAKDEYWQALRKYKKETSHAEVLVAGGKSRDKIIERTNINAIRSRESIVGIV